jgi:hypothetical protein
MKVFLSYLPSTFIFNPHRILTISMTSKINNLYKLLNTNIVIAD